MRGNNIASTEGKNKSAKIEKNNHKNIMKETLKRGETYLANISDELSPFGVMPRRE